MTPSLQTVRQWYAASQARDSATLRELAHPRIEFVVADGYPAGGRYVGPGAVFDEFFPRSFTNLARIAAVPEEFFAVDGERVVVRGHYVGRTRATDTPFEVPFAHLWRARDGKLVWMQQYTDTALLRDAIEGRSTKDNRRDTPPHVDHH